MLVIAPTRAACETIEIALHSRVDTVLDREHGGELRQWARDGKGFGIVAGTGTGKTLGIRPIAEVILGEPLQVDVVNREREATAATTQCNVVIVTTGIARRWLCDDLISARDTIVVDEIHQTSAELELCLALGKRAGCRFIWLSATVDPEVYRRYLASDEVLQTSAFDPELKASVTVTPQGPERFLDDHTVRKFIADRRGVAVFLPTRAEVERLGADLAGRFPRLNAAFYHGGEPIRVIRPFLDGEVARPFLLAMTAAGQSALNVPGLDTVIIEDARYGTVVDHGRNVLHRLHLGANEILQMAGRVHGRVAGGKVVILSDRPLDFASLQPGPPEFQLAGDAERVALTCAELGVDATELELPVPLDRDAYRRAVRTLTDRGLIAAGRLTDYGRQVEAMPVDRPWGELLVNATSDELPLVAGSCGIDSLHRMTREDRDLRGAVVPGSDHLTAYNLLVEAIEQCGSIATVHGLRRHVFDESGLEEWAAGRGVLVKAIEDAALGLAAAYRALDAELPAGLPPVTRHERDIFVDLLARIEPFDLVIGQHTAAGQAARISKTSVIDDDWAAVAGTIRYFADRSGTPRASIEGTAIPAGIIRKYATAGPATIVITGHRNRQGFGVSRTLAYFGFELERSIEKLPDTIPEPLRSAAREAVTDALLQGTVEHPSRSRLLRAAETLDEYWRRSGGGLRGIDPVSRRQFVAAQLEDVDSWATFQRTAVTLDVAALVPDAERAHLEALPGSARIRGDAAPIVYEVRDGLPLARLILREGQARRVRDDELPALDRPLAFAVRRGSDTVQADSLPRLRDLLRNQPASRHHSPHRSKHRRHR